VNPRALLEKPGPRIAMVLAALLLPLLIFYADMIFEAKEPFAGDTAVNIAYRAWKDENRAAGDGIPGWYPRIYLGMPSFGSFIHTSGGPLAWLQTTLDLSRGTKYLLWFFLGGLGAYGLLRRWGASLPAALLGALTFILTPYMLGSLNAGHSSKIAAMAFAPVVWWGVDLVLGRRSLAAIGLCAWAIALQLWTNHPQIVVYTWLVVGPYALVWLWREGGADRARALGALVTAGVLAGLMIMLPYLPVYDYSHASIRGAPSVLEGAQAAGTGSWDYATMWSFHPRELPSFVFPAAFGLQGQTYWGWMPFTQSTHAFGTVPLVFAVLGSLVLTGWRRAFVLAAAGAILVIGFGRHLPLLFGPLYHLFPFFDKFRVPSMIYAMLPLLAAVPMALALDRVASGSPASRGLDRTLKVLLIGFGVTLGFGLLGSGLADTLAAQGWFRRDVEAGAALPPTLVEERQSLLFGDLLRASVLALVAAGAVWLRLRGRIPVAAFWTVAIAVTAIDVVSIDRNFYDPVPRPDIDRRLGLAPELQAALDAEPGPVRILPVTLRQGSGGGLTVQMAEGASWTRAGAQIVGGYHTAGLRRARDFVESGAWRSPPVWRMLDVRWVVLDLPGLSDRVPNVDEVMDQIRPFVSAQLPGLVMLLEHRDEAGTTVIYRVPDGPGRAWVVPAARVEPDGGRRLELLGRPALDPRAEVILESEVVSPAAASGADWTATAAITSYDDDRVEVTVAGDGGYLVLADAYYDDWKAELDGAEVDVHPANHTLRAVAVPPGEHRLVFRFTEPARRIGTLLSWTGQLLSVLLIGAGIVLARRRGPAPGTGEA